MTRKIILPHKTTGTVGSDSPASPETDPRLEKYEDLSIDLLMKKVLLSIDRLMRTVLADISTGDKSRETVQALKDCSAMLMDLKKQEQEILEEMSLDELKAKADTDDNQ